MVMACLHTISLAFCAGYPLVEMTLVDFVDLEQPPKATADILAIARQVRS
jgi:hypothetical protein